MRREPHTVTYEIPADAPAEGETDLEIARFEPGTVPPPGARAIALDPVGPGEAEGVHRSDLLVFRGRRFKIKREIDTPLAVPITSAQVVAFPVCVATDVGLSPAYAMYALLR